MLVHTCTEIDVVKLIAARMKDPEFVKCSVESPLNKNPYSIYPNSYWNDLSIASGYPGVLPLFIELDRQFPAEGWDQTIHDYVIKIKASIESQGLSNLGMFGGMAGICFYLKEASRNKTRYKKMLHKLDAFLLEKVDTTYLEPFRGYLKTSQAPPPMLYEVIQGLAGIGIYGILNSAQPAFQAFVGEIIRLFVLLTRSLQVEGKIVPGWHVRSEYFFLDEEKTRNPKGNFNMGLSHGIPGVLAFLSIAKLCGINLEGQAAAIERIANWLMQKRLESSSRYFWNSSLSFEDELSSTQSNDAPARDAWCYGTPGIARSLYLAGEALEDAKLKTFALESYLSIFKSSSDKWILPGPTFCHGLSGLLMITSLMARDTQSSELQNQIIRLKMMVLEHYHSGYAFGFKNRENITGHQFALIDRADLLEGASGVLLTLLSLQTKGYTWHLPFLIDSPHALREIL